MVCFAVFGRRNGDRMTQKKRTVLSVLLILLLLGALTFTAAATEVVFVGGEGHAAGKAESATLYLSVDAEGESEKAAAAESRRRTQEAEKILAPLGDVTVTGFHAYPEDGRVRVGRELVFTTKHPEKIPTLFERLSTVGGVSVHGVSYEAARSDEAAKEALLRAVAAAKEKAKALGITADPDAVRETECYTTENGGKITVISRVELRYGKRDEKAAHPSSKPPKEQ